MKAEHLKYKIVFDFDQTLAYRQGMWTVTIHELLVENGYGHIKEDDIRAYIKLGLPWDFYEKSHCELFGTKTWWEYVECFVEFILTDQNIQPAEARKISKQLRDRYLDIRKWFLYPDTISVLQHLSDGGYECYILSNHTPELETIVEGLSLNRLIKKIYNSSLIGYDKPNSRIYQHVITDLQTPPSSLLMVGDNFISDITGARSNGISAIQVRSKNEFNYPFYSDDLTGILPIIGQFELGLHHRPLLKSVYEE